MNRSTQTTATQAKPMGMVVAVVRPISDDTTAC
jgi:hypothetical protein